LHDSGHSFWWGLAILLGFAPIEVAALIEPAALKGNLAAALVFDVLLLVLFVLLIWMVILLCRPSDVGPNRYGERAPATPD
jgi:uncharacterized membrane protein YhaH (DUF805 family)